MPPEWIPGVLLVLRAAVDAERLRMDVVERDHEDDPTAGVVALGVQFPRAWGTSRV